MSTFDGIVKEFPDIRVDYFRQSSEQLRPPLAYFLSHVHTDHLSGLETCKSPFIYCSAATREILLRLEKYPHRMNFARGIVEKHHQHFRHLKKLLKPIPLETPTTIELSPENSIRVTLFDANHCVGAVCFLLEGDGKAVLYTGDVRAENWWVNSLCRHPLLVPYVPSTGILLAPLKRLDCIYLDTTFAAKDDAFQQFPSKASGLAELLLWVSRYPKGTAFYFDSWTFGYEDVWQALSAHLGSQIHVDDYRYGLYLALANGQASRAPEAAKLTGFHCGNHFQEGCLTSAQARLHSCEKDFVRITPIISRHNGMEIAELGAGGGHGDLDTHHELEVGDAGIVGQLIALCASKLQSQPQLLASVMELLTGFISGRVSSVSLDGSGFIENCTRAADEDDFVNVDELPLERLVPVLANLVTAKQKGSESLTPRSPKIALKRSDGLPKQITFPYSRHSSYGELCDLIDAFKPKDIHPCTVDEANWTTAHSMSFLFGHIYTSNPTFGHDQMMLKKRGVTLDETSMRARPPPPRADEQHGRSIEDTQRQREDERRIAHKTQQTADQRSDDPSVNGGPRNDFWPRLETVDRRPLPQSQRKRKLPKAPSPDTAALDALRKASLPFNTQETAIRRARSSSKRSSENMMPGEWLKQNSQRFKRHPSSDDEPEDGRLSPPPFDMDRSPPRDPHSAALLRAAEGRRLFIGNLASGTTSADLKSLTSSYAVENSYIPPTASDSSHLAGFGFVDLATAAEAQRAMAELRGTTLKGRRIRIELARGAESEYAEPAVSIMKYENEQPSADKARLALRHEADDAALNADGIHWSRLGLVSTSSGHQIKEEEL